MSVWIVRVLWIVSVLSHIMLPWIVFPMNNTGMNNVSCEIMLGWTLLHVNSARSITPSKYPNVNLNVWIVNEHSCFVQGPPNIIDMFQGHGTNPHGWIMLYWPCLTGKLNLSLPIHCVWIWFLHLAYEGASIILPWCEVTQIMGRNWHLYE